MFINKKVVSNIPRVITWVALLILIYINMKGITKDTVNQLPNSTNVILVSMVGLFLFRFLLEKFLPRKEVVFAEKVDNEIIIKSGGIKYFNHSIPINEISDIKIGKTYFSNSLYIFLKDGNVKIVSDKLTELERLYSFINNAVKNPNKLRQGDDLSSYG